MEINAVSKLLLDMLKENELEMMRMYKTFSESFNLYDSFWREISGEEESHASWVETLYYKTEAGLVNFSENRFPVKAIKNNIEFMRETRQKAEAGELTLLGALEQSVRMERGMLENKFFEVFEGDSVELEIILHALRLGTQEHFREIERVWKKEALGADFEQWKS